MQLMMDVFNMFNEVAAADVWPGQALWQALWSAAAAALTTVAVVFHHNITHVYDFYHSHKYHCY